LLPAKLVTSLQVNGYYDLYFGPKASKGYENN